MDPIPLVLDSECREVLECLEDPTTVASADYGCQIGHMKKMLRELEQYYKMLYRHLQNPKKDQKLQDPKKDHKLHDPKKNVVLKRNCVDDKKRLLQLICNTVLRELDDSKKDDSLEDLLNKPENLLFGHGPTFNLGKESFFKIASLPKRTECTDSNLLHELMALWDSKVNG